MPAKKIRSSTGILCTAEPLSLCFSHLLLVQIFFCKLKCPLGLGIEEKVWLNPSSVQLHSLSNWMQKK